MFDRRPRLARGAAAATALTVTFALAVLLLVPAPTAPASYGRWSPELTATPGSSPPVVTGLGLTLGIAAAPSAICDQSMTACPAGAGATRVTLTAVAGTPGENEWPAVQVVFVVETTPYDGVYDPSAGAPGSDVCADQLVGTSTLCEESNGVPFFVAQAGAVARAIQGAHPRANVTFGMVDFFATHDAWDDGDGAQYRVDVGRFTNASDFGGQVTSTFQARVLQGGYVLPRSDLADNFLHASSITALYGTLLGAGGLDWSNTTHHVVVLVGSAAPRDPAYPENYCVSPAVSPVGLTNCEAPTCEPGGPVGPYFLPACEGWVTSHDTNASHSIAALASSSPSCSGALGGNCTIDVIDLNDTPTDPGSPAWSAGGGSGGPANWTQDASNILRAGCDLSKATGGTWDGPTWFECPGTSVHGTLAYVAHGSSPDPNTQNPSLAGAFVHIGFGEVADPVVARGPLDRPMFDFVPFGTFSYSPLIAPTSACSNATGVPIGCPATPSRLSLGGGLEALGWNISSSPAANLLHLGDSWSVSFGLAAYGGPYGPDPVDACVTTACFELGSHELQGSFSSAGFFPYGGANEVSESFGPAVVTVEPLTALVSVPPPPPPSAFPPPTTSPAPSTPPSLPASVGSAVPATFIAIEAASAGAIAAGFARIAVRNRPIALGMATPAGRRPSKRRRGERPPIVGHFE